MGAKNEQAQPAPQKIQVRRKQRFFRTNTGIILVRFFLSAILVMITFNPFEQSLYHWVKAQPELFSNAKVVVAMLVVFAAHILALHAIFKGPGKIGVILISLILIAGGWMSFQEKWVSTENVASMQWLGVIVATVLYTFGLCFAIFYRRVTGQIIADTDAGD